jgi:CBS domain containing-hemolysin-like protein
MLRRNDGSMDTCTDVIEEIISEEIVDETDQFEDNQSKRRAKRMTTAAVMRGCVFPFSPFSHTAYDRWILALSRESVEATQQIRIPKNARHCW